MNVNAKNLMGTTAHIGFQDGNNGVQVSTQIYDGNKLLQNASVKEPVEQESSSQKISDKHNPTVGNIASGDSSVGNITGKSQTGKVTRDGGKGKTEPGVPDQEDLHEDIVARRKGAGPEPATIPNVPDPDEEEDKI